MTTPLLDDEDLTNIDEALRLAESAEDDLRKAEQAGLDIVGQRTRLAETKARLAKIKGAFFPNR